MAKGESRKKPEGGVVAASGAHGIRQMFIGELSPDPRQRARYSTGIWIDDANTLQLYRNVLADQRAFQALEQRLNAAISKPMQVKPGGDSRRDRKAAEDLTTKLAGIKFETICKKLLHAIWFGYSIGEVIYAPDYGTVRMHDIRVRAAERFRWNTDNQPLLKTLENPAGSPLPENKFVILRRPGDHDDIPYAPGLARWCYWPAYLKRHGLKFWAIALEKFGTPTAKGKYQRGATDDEKDMLLDILMALANGLAVALPDDQEIDLLEAMRRSGGDFDIFCRYMDALITTTILGQSSTTDQGPWRGTAEIQMEVRDEAVAADCRMLNEALNSTISPWLTDWNFPGAAYPIITRDTDPPEDLDARVDREEKISKMTGLRPTRRHIEETYGGEWEESGRPSQSGTGAGAMFADDHDDPITAAALEAAQDWRLQMEPVVRPLLDAADNANDLDEFQSLIDSDEVSDAMRSDRLQQRLTNTQFSSAVSGDVESGEI